MIDFADSSSWEKLETDEAVCFKTDFGAIIFSPAASALGREDLLEMVINGFDSRFQTLSAEDREIIRTSKGKPLFRSLPLFLSVTDSHGWTAIAVSRSEIGIDLEQVRDLSWEKIAKRFYSESEQNYLRNAEDFFTVWTAKESYVKFTGEGITSDFAEFSVFDLKEKITVYRLPSQYILSVCRDPKSR